MKREAKINRNTSETKINLYINLDGEGISDIDTGIGFFDHMLNLFSFYSGINLTISCDGDIHVCDHHTVEDIGIALGMGFNKALGDKVGIERYGTSYLPMDESLALVSLDISGRPYLIFDCDFNREIIGEFSTEMVEEFFRAFAFNSGITLHMKMIHGKNDHHKIEALFKGLGKAIKIGKSVTNNKIQSTKGIL